MNENLTDVDFLLTCSSRSIVCFFFFFNDTATTEIYTLSLHDALPICPVRHGGRAGPLRLHRLVGMSVPVRSEEHTSELQSRPHLVCRLLLEKKKKQPSRTLLHPSAMK